MTGASRILWDAKGRPSVDDAEEHAGLCWVCARPMSRGVRVDRWQGANFTGQNKVRAPAATHVCEPCIWSMQGTPPNCLRMYSHLWADGEGYIAPNKGNKPAMLAFLRKHHAGAWFAAIADSGKKQLVPWTPVNPPGSRRGRILFEDQEVTLPVADGAGWALVDRLRTLLTAGATKDEILRGEWSPRAYSLLGAEAIDLFEEQWGRPKRGGSWFALAVWLAQRDEVAVSARMDAEKATRAAAKQKAKEQSAKPKKERKGATDRKGQGKTADRDGGGDSRPSGRVPANGSKRAQALGPDTGQAPSGSTDIVDTGGVALDDAPHLATGRNGQLSMF